MKKPRIDQETCITCRACVGICPVEALKQFRREIVLDYDACTGCKICGKFCSAGAITFVSFDGAPIPEKKAIKTPSHLDKSFDIVIVGGGIAGLSTAIGTLQSKQDLDILVIERKRVIGEDSNSSAGTWHFTLDMLPLTDSEKDEIILQKFTKLGLANEHDDVVIDNNGYYLGAIDLQRLLVILFRKVQKLGGQIEVNSFVESVERVDGGFEIGVVSKGEVYKISSKLIVDATGVDSTVSRRLGMHKSWGVEEIGVGAEYEMSWHGDSQTAWLIPLGYRNLGYAWVFPIGNNLARVGVAGPLQTLKKHKMNIQEELDKFLKYCAIVKENIGDDYSILAFKSGAYPVLEMSEDITRDQALRVGDSASQANPLLGEGIYYCINYGLKAGEALAKSNSGSEEDLASYKAFVLKNKEKFETDKLGFGMDTDKVIENLQKNLDKLSERERQVLLEFLMPVEQDWKTKIRLSKKLLGTKETLKLFGSEIKKRL
jgi:digeranylgeranylglycerophospholipid reductase